MSIQEGMVFAKLLGTLAFALFCELNRPGVDDHIIELADIAAASVTHADAGE